MCASCVRSNLTYLAGSALRGRGSGSEDEHHAAQFIAGRLQDYGLVPAAGEQKFIQTAAVRSRRIVGAPTLTVAAESKGSAPRLVLTHGKQMVVAELSSIPVSAPLEKLDLSSENGADVTPGAALLVKVKAGTSFDELQILLEPYRTKAALVIVTSSDWQPKFASLAKLPPPAIQELGEQPEGPRAPLVLAKPESFDRMWTEPDGRIISLNAEVTPWKVTRTWNVLGKIEGTRQPEQMILLSAHLDHLGIENGETYYGADDDASGTVAVMELARLLAKQPKPARTIVVALWGSEEKGMIGARYFLENPPFSLNAIVANLEFEMIGRPDAKIEPDGLWLTGWDRTNLGPELVQNGANLVADPHPAEKFFTRSDNYMLAKQGVIAQTISSFGLHKDYHQPTDTVDKIDFQHLDRAIASLIGPLTWLANTDYKPEWIEGKKP